jgi:ArsR family transcriptional regulator
MSLETVLSITRALSESHRLRAYAALQSGEMCVCEIIELLGLAPSTVSRHMAVLHQAGLVQSRKSGRWIHYRRTAPAEMPGEVRSLLRALMRSIEEAPQIRRDRESLETIGARAGRPAAMCCDSR